MCTNPRVSDRPNVWICVPAPNISGPSVWDLLHITCWRLEFKGCCVTFWTCLLLWWLLYVSAAVTLNILRLFVILCQQTAITSSNVTHRLVFCIEGTVYLLWSGWLGRFYEVGKTSWRLHLSLVSVTLYQSLRNGCTNKGLLVALMSECGLVVSKYFWVIAFLDAQNFELSPGLFENLRALSWAIAHF